MVVLGSDFGPRAGDPTVFRRPLHKKPLKRLRELSDGLRGRDGSKGLRSLNQPKSSKCNSTSTLEATSNWAYDPN